MRIASSAAARSLLVLLLAASAAACGEGSDSSVGTVPTPTPTPTTTAVRVVNASAGAVDVVVDGEVVLRGLTARSVSARVGVTAGAHSVELRPVGAASGAATTVTVATGRTGTVAALAGAQLSARTLSDTGAAPVAGRGKLRVIHLAASAPSVDVWRTQPDFPTPIRVMFPFAYLAESSYIQSTPGTWTVFVTPADQTEPVLGTSGPIEIGGGQVRTVLILDVTGGGLQLVPID